MINQRPDKKVSKKPSHDWGIELEQRTPRLVAAQRAISDAKKRWYLRKSEAGTETQELTSELNASSFISPPQR